MSRRRVLALGGSLLLARREGAISHFSPCGMFRGNARRTGFYDTCGAAPQAKLEPFFAAPGAGKIVASPLLVEDLVCAGYCTVRNLVLRRPRPHRFAALDRRTGRPRWTFQAEKDIVSSPAYWEDTILVAGLDGRLYAYDLDGARKWVFQADGGIFGSPAVFDGYVVFACGDMEGGRLYCLDLRTRRLKWPPVPLPCGPFASPCIAGGNIFLGTYWNLRKDAFYYVVDLRTGTVRKRLKFAVVCFCSTPASDGKTVYIADCGEWQRPSRFYAWDARTAREKWRLELEADNVGSSIALLGDLAVFGDDRGRLHAVNVRHGQLAWTSSYRAKAYHGSPSATPGRIYIGSVRGALHIFDHQGRHLRAYRAGGPIESTPVIDDGELFVGCNDGVLYRLAADAP